nr:MAG: hypothetical protein [Caudoviricetes sp.]
MGILSTVKTDVEELWKGGFDEVYISKSTGMDLNIIKYIIKYLNEPKKINNKELIKGGQDGFSHRFR